MVAATLGVGWHTVMRAVRDYGRPLVEDPARTEGVVAVGVDETAFLAANAGSHTQFVTGIVAMLGPDESGRSCSMLSPAGREPLSQWMSARDLAWRAQVHDRVAGPVPRLRRLAHQPARRGAGARRLSRRAPGPGRGRRRSTSPAAGDPRPAWASAGPTAAGGYYAAASSPSTSGSGPAWTLTAGDPSGRLTQAWMVAQELQLALRPQPRPVRRQAPVGRILERCAPLGRA